jgi:predicted deacylase
MSMIAQPAEAFDLGSIAPGTKTNGWLRIAPDLAGDCAVPLLVVKGARPGRTLFAVAGVHGNEYEGIEALLTLFAGLEPGQLRGSLVAIPVANPYAYQARTRATPREIDGLNLARVFPGNPHGLPTQVLAAALLSLVERTVGPDDLFIDFHSGSEDVRYAPLVGVRDVASPVRAHAEEAARRFGLPRLWAIPDSSGPFNAETARRGIPTIGTETTGRAGCEPEDVAAFLRGLESVLGYLGIIDRAPLPPSRDVFLTSRDVLAPATGYFQPCVPIFARVQAGEAIGRYRSLDGGYGEEVVSPLTGEIWALRATPAVRSGELIATVTDGFRTGVDEA